jgi:hypothetical protein
VTVSHPSEPIFPPPRHRGYNRSMSEPQKKPVWMWVVTVAIALPVLYVASFGPACWISQRTGAGGRILGVVYLPIGMAYWFTRLCEPIEAYASFGTADNMKLQAWSFDGPLWVGRPPPELLWDSVEEINDSRPGDVPADEAELPDR